MSEQHDDYKQRLRADNLRNPQPDDGGAREREENAIDHDARFSREEIARFIDTSLAYYKDRGEPTPKEVEVYEMLAKTFRHDSAATILRQGPEAVQREKAEAYEGCKHSWGFGSTCRLCGLEWDAPTNPPSEPAEETTLRGCRGCNGRGWVALNSPFAGEEFTPTSPTMPGAYCRLCEATGREPSALRILGMIEALTVPPSEVSGEEGEPTDDVISRTLSGLDDAAKLIHDLAVLIGEAALAAREEPEPVAEWRVERKGPNGWRFMQHTRDARHIEHLNKRGFGPMFRMVPLYTAPPKPEQGAARELLSHLVDALQIFGKEDYVNFRCYNDAVVFLSAQPAEEEKP